MALLSRTIRKKIDVVVASLLFAGGAFSFVYAVKASVAQSMYKKAKYGFFAGHSGEIPKISSAEEASSQAFDAAKLYPHNYYFPAYAAKLALEEALDAAYKASLPLEADEAQEAEDLYKSKIKKALHFSEMALNINPYDAESRMLYAHSLTENGDVAEAISFWETKVVEREFWNSQNHDVLVRLYLRASDPESLNKAVREIPLVSDTELRKELTELKKLIGR